VRAAALAAVVFLALACVASASDGDVVAAMQRFLPLAQRHFTADADGWQARYDAARDLQDAVRPFAASAACAGTRAALLRFARAQIAIAEQADYPVPRSKPRVLPRVPSTCVAGSPATVGTPPRPVFHVSPRAAPEGARDPVVAAKLAVIGRSYRGWAGFWVHDLRTGSIAGWNSDAVFAAGSMVKLGPLLAAQPYASLAYDARQVASWSSNLGANRIFERVGAGAVNDALRRLGMWSSTYPGLYRAGTSAVRDAPRRPPPSHTRVTTAHDLGRALYRIHAAAVGNRLALAQLGVTRTQAQATLAALLRSRPLGDNVGLVRPWLPTATIAQKNAWLSDLRTTAAIVYAPAGPTIVVVEAYRPGIEPREARDLARRALRAAGL
jgi:beta-lactamase family protein